MAVATAVTAGAIGACAGSFIGSAVVRGARSEQPWTGRSHCDACGAHLDWASTIPIVSYAVARGACGRCRAPIDRTHLAAEAAALVVVALPFLFLAPVRAVLVAGLGLTLVWASLVDARTGRLPDPLTLACLALSAALALAKGWTALGAGLAVAGGAFVVLEALRRLFIHARGAPGLGFGDVKLIAALAVWTGLATAWGVVLASCTGLLFMLARRPASGTIAFGPFIAGAVWTVGFVREAWPWPPLI